MGRTVAELRSDLTADEFESWMEFFSLYPFDDLHRHHRPAAMISVCMSGGEEALADRLEFLQPDPATADMSDVDKSILKAVME